MNKPCEEFEHPSCLPIDQLLTYCRVQRTKGSGPGGQHRNKVETMVVVTHQPTGIVGQASESRQQETNRKKAIDRLRRNLAVGVQADATLDCFPTPRWRQRVRAKRLSVSVEHFDYACLLAESLEVLRLAEFDVKEVGERLCVSSSQLVKFWKQFQPAMTWVNSERAKHGLRLLK